MEENKNGGNLAIAALVCGILGIIGGWIPVVQYFTFVLAILGIVFGVKARKTAPEDKRGLATAGLVCGIVGAAVGAVGILCVLCAAAALGTAITSGLYSALILL